MEEEKNNLVEENSNIVNDEQKSEISQLTENVDELDKKINKKKKRKVSRIIFNILFTIVFIIIIFEAVVGIIDMKKINNNEEPIWYLNHKKTEDDTKIVNDYNIGLYRIVKTETSKETRTVLKLFFIDE